jgi:hypothetical protein
MGCRAIDDNDCDDNNNKLDLLLLLSVKVLLYVSIVVKRCSFIRGIFISIIIHLSLRRQITYLEHSQLTIKCKDY